MSAKILNAKEKIGKISFIAAVFPIEADEMAPFAEELMHSLKSGVVVIGSAIGERCQLLVQVSEDLAAKNISAQALVKEAAALIGGGGGGKATLAQAGGKDPSGLPQAINRIREHLGKIA